MRASGGRRCAHRRPRACSAASTQASASARTVSRLWLRTPSSSSSRTATCGHGGPAWRARPVSSAGRALARPSGGVPGASRAHRRAQRRAARRPQRPRRTARPPMRASPARARGAARCRAAGTRSSAPRGLPRRTQHEAALARRACCPPRWTEAQRPCSGVGPKLALTSSPAPWRGAGQDSAAGAAERARRVTGRGAPPSRLASASSILVLSAHTSCQRRRHLRCT